MFFSIQALEKRFLCDASSFARDENNFFSEFQPEGNDNIPPPVDILGTNNFDDYLAYVQQETALAIINYYSSILTYSLDNLYNNKPLTLSDIFHTSSFIFSASSFCIFNVIIDVQYSNYEKYFNITPQENNHIDSKKNDYDQRSDNPRVENNVYSLPFISTKISMPYDYI